MSSGNAIIAIQPFMSEGQQFLPSFAIDETSGMGLALPSMEAAMFTYVGLVGATALLMLAVCLLDGDFDEGRPFATLLKRLRGSLVTALAVSARRPSLDDLVGLRKK